MSCARVRDVKATHRDSTSAAQHKTQGKRKADRWKIDCERRREEHKTLLDFPSLKSLNYNWLLFFYFNIVHLCGPITYKSIWVWHVHIIHLLVFELMSYTLALYYRTRTVTVQLPTRVLQGICYSSPTVVSEV